MSQSISAWLAFAFLSFALSDCAPSKVIRTSIGEFEYRVSFSDERTDGPYERHERRSEYRGGDPKRMKTIDRWVEEEIGSQHGIELKDLALLLARKPKSKREKARAIFAWIVKNIEYDLRVLHEPTYFPPCTPKDVLERRKGVCSCYARLFQALAEQMGIEAMIVRGWARSWGTMVGGKKERLQCAYHGGAISSNHAWIAVRLEEDRWHLVDPTWGSGYVSEDGKKFIRAYKPYFFDTPPHMMILTHLPDVAWLQLLSSPVSCTKFANTPQIWAPSLKTQLRYGPEILPHIVPTQDRVLFGLSAPSGTRIKLSIRPVMYEETDWTSFNHTYRAGDGRRIATIMIEPSCDGEHEVLFHADGILAAKLIVDRRPLLHAPDIGLSAPKITTGEREFEPTVKEAVATKPDPVRKSKRKPTLNLDLDGNGSAVDSVELEERLAIVRVVRDEAPPVITKFPILDQLYRPRLTRLGDVDHDGSEDFAVIGSRQNVAYAMVRFGSKQGIRNASSKTLVLKPTNRQPYFFHPESSRLGVKEDFDGNGTKDLVFSLPTGAAGYRSMFSQVHLVGPRGTISDPAGVSGSFYGWRGVKDCAEAYMENKVMKEVLRRLRTFVERNKSQLKPPKCQNNEQPIFIARIDTGFGGKVIVDRTTLGVGCPGVTGEALPTSDVNFIKTEDLHLPLPKGKDGFPFLCYYWANLKIQ